MPIDNLVNAAGVNLRQPFSAVTAEAFDLHMALHLRAPFLLTQAFAPGMAERLWGRIINIASLQSYRAFPNSAPYGAGKGGVVQLTRAIARNGRGMASQPMPSRRLFPTPLTAPVFGDPERAARNAQQTAIGRTGRLMISSAQPCSSPPMPLPIDRPDARGGWRLHGKIGFPMKAFP